MKKILLNLLLLLMMSIGAVAQTTIFSEDFEGGTMPDGWTTDGPGAWSVGTGDYSTSTGAGEGTYNAKITHGSTDDVTKLITPEIDLSSAASAELSFMHIERSWGGDYDELRVYYRTSSSDSWTQLLEYTIVYATWTTEEGVVLPNLSGTYQLAFEMTDGYGYGVGIDFVKISTPPSCPKPSTLAANSITATTATIEWTPGSETNWVLKYGVAGFDVETAGTQETVESTPTFDLTGLTPNTEYDVYVKAVCSESEESDWRSTSFRTECAVLTVDAENPYTEGFETTDEEEIPDCWERVVEYTSYGATYPYVYDYDYYANSGTKLLYMYTYYYSAPENVIALPLMNNINTLQISLWARSYSIAPEAFEVGYIKSGVFTSVQSFTITSTYQKYVAYMNVAPADAERIAIRAYHSSSSIYVYIDDIEVSLIPSCVAPLNVEVSDIAINTASVSWTDVMPATAWQYQLNDGDIEDVDAKPINLTGLTANTEYTIKVRTVCSESENSDWTEVSFTTLCDAVTVFPWLENFNSLTEANSIPSCWDNSEGTTTTESYRWCYNTSTSGNGATNGTSYDGSNCVRFDSYNNGNGSTNMLKSSTLDLSGITSAKLDFWYKNPAGGDFSVYVSTDGGVTYTGNVVATGLTGVSSWTNATYDISSYCGNSNVVIVFVGTSNWGSGNAYIYLDDVTVREPSTAAEILTYSLPTQTAEATIDSENGTIAITVANSTDLDALVPAYTISDYAEISTPTITGEGDSRTIEYTVTAEAGNEKDWTVTVTKAPISHDAFITAFTFAGQKEGTEAVIVSEDDTYTVNAVAVWNADLTAIAPVVTISNAATVAPESGDVQDFTNPVTYTVTAEDGTTTHAYTVTIVNDPDACINPSTVSISNITNNSATASWTQAYTETSYLVKVSSEAMTDMDEEADVFDGTVNALTKDIDGLTANTQYFVYVQSDCDNAEGWTLSSFTTLCDAVAEFPWTEDFNSLTVSNSIPSCWDNSEGTTTTESYKWCYTTSSNYSGYGSSSGTSHDGSNCVRFDSYNNSNNRTNMLKTPSLDLTELTSAKLDFWYKNVAGGDFSVYVSTDGGATYTGNVVATGLTGVSSWTNAVYDISSYCGNSNVVIVFMGTSNYGSGNAYIYLDDVTVREPYTGAEIVDFNFPTRMADPVIDSENATVTAIASYQADFATLAEEVTISEGASIVETDATVNENVKTFEYTVTAENGTTKDWTVTVTKAESASTANDIVSFSFADQVGESVINTEAKTVTAYAEWNFDLETTDITPTITVSPMATIDPASGVAQNFNEPVQYAVTAEDGTSIANWTVTITNDPNACINPAEIALDAATATTATLKWEKAYLETSYLVKVSTTEMDDMDAEADVYDGEVTLTGDEATLELTGLTPATFYYIYVQSNCGADGWTDGLFGTECDGSAYSVPFVETFDLSSSSLLCWNIIDANEDVTEYGNGAWHFDGEEAYYLYHSSNAANDWLISPKLAIVEGSYLTFDYAVDNDYYPEKFSVYVMTDIADYATATQIRATAQVTNEEFASIDNIDLSAYAGQDIYIGIKCESAGNMDALLIDNFKVTLPVYTITATAGENGTIDPASAEVMLGYDKDITITPAEGYEIASVIVDADTEDEEDVSEELTYDDGVFTYTFENVTANHTIHATFRELQTYTITVNITGNGTVVAIDDDENEISAENGVITVNHYDDVYLVITPAEHNLISSVYVNGSEMDLNAYGDTLPLLAVEENYTVNVTFVPEMAVDMIEAGSMTVYPNPNNGMFSIDFSNIEGDATYQIIDARGAVVETRDINVMNGATMNFNHDLKAGTYFVRIISGDKVYVEQIVVE